MTNNLSDESSIVLLPKVEKDGMNIHTQQNISEHGSIDSSITVLMFSTLNPQSLNMLKNMSKQNLSIYMKENSSAPSWIILEIQGQF